MLSSRLVVAFSWLPERRFLATSIGSQGLLLRWFVDDASICQVWGNKYTNVLHSTISAFSLFRKGYSNALGSIAVLLLLLRFYPRASRRNICLFRSVGHSGAFQTPWKEPGKATVQDFSYSLSLYYIYYKKIFICLNEEMHCAAIETLFITLYTRKAHVRRRQTSTE